MAKQIIFDEQMAAQLKGYVARMIKLKLQIDEAKVEIRRLYAEARACKFDTFALRKVVDRRVLEEKAKKSYKQVGTGLTDAGNNAESVYEAVLKHKGE